MRKEFLTRLLVYVANFAFAIGVLIVSCAWSGIYPFGDRSFLTEDLMFQYVDFFTWFQNVLLGEGSLFYSTSQALGNNRWGLYSYYLGSPLNFLIVFFEQGAITEFVFFVTALKIGFVQVATVFFIRKRFGLSYFLCSVLALGFRRPHLPSFGRMGRVRAYQEQAVGPAHRFRCLGGYLLLVYGLHVDSLPVPVLRI